MIQKIVGEQPFQVLADNFSIGPASVSYTLQISADGSNYSNLFNVAANTTRLVTNVANGSYYKLKDNEGEVVVNWRTQCGGGSSEGGSEPAEYIKNAVVYEESNTLELEKKDGTIISFTPEGGSSESIILKAVDVFPADAIQGDTVAKEDGVYELIGYKTQQEIVAGMANVRGKVFNVSEEMCFQMADNAFVRYAIKTYATEDDYNNDANGTFSHYGLYVVCREVEEEGVAKWQFGTSNDGENIDWIFDAVSKDEESSMNAYIDVPYDLEDGYNYVSNVNLNIYTNQYAGYATVTLAATSEDYINGLSRLSNYGSNKSTGYWQGVRNNLVPNWQKVGGHTIIPLFDNGDGTISTTASLDDVKTGFAYRNIMFKLPDEMDGMYVDADTYYSEGEGYEWSCEVYAISEYYNVYLTANAYEIGGVEAKNSSLTYSDNSTIRNIIKLTQDEYDEIQDKDGSTLYIIAD